MCEIVVKIGGGMLASIDDLDRTLAALARLARVRRVIIVPGGGPFADVVRDVDRRLGLDDDTAHWMAIIGMDQYAHLLAARTPSARLVGTLADASASLDGDRLPILAPAAWLRAADPLPHSWDVTSDSIAAWIAGEAGAGILVLVKPTGATGAVVDPYFARIVPRGASVHVVPASAAPELFAEFEAGVGT